MRTFLQRAKQIIQWVMAPLRMNDPNAGDSNVPDWF